MSLQVERGLSQGFPSALCSHGLLGEEEQPGRRRQLPIDAAAVPSQYMVAGPWCGTGHWPHFGLVQLSAQSNFASICGSMSLVQCGGLVGSVLWGEGSGEKKGMQPPNGRVTLLGASEAC